MSTRFQNACAKHGKTQPIRYVVTYAQCYQKHKKLIILRAWVKALRRSLPNVIMQKSQFKSRKGKKSKSFFSADYYPIQRPPTGIFDNSSVKLFFQRTAQSVWCDIAGSRLEKHLGSVMGNGSHMATWAVLGEQRAMYQGKVGNAEGSHRPQLPFVVAESPLSLQY